MQGPLSAKRRNVITKVFEDIDSDGDGVISMTDIGSCFNPKGHPDVKNGLKKVPVLMGEFFDAFESVTQNGYVNLEQFLEYYANSSFFEDDESFFKTMNAIWNTKSIKKQQFTTKSSGGKSLGHIADSRVIQKFSDGEGLSSEHTIVEDLRAQLKSRGAKGIIGLARKFRIMDDDGSKALRLSEFKKGLRESSFNISEQNIVSLFNHFDKDKSGSIDFDEFLAGLRVCISFLVYCLSYCCSFLKSGYIPYVGCDE